MVEAITPFARVDFRDDDRVFGMKRNDRRYHLLTIGRTGTGKSTLLAAMIKGDLEGNEGLAVIDPHGDLADIAKRLVPRWRKNVIVFEPGSPKNHLRFNPLHVPRPDQRHLVVSELITVYLYPTEAPDLQLDGVLTGHIDVLQVRYGKVWILDYKPDARRETRARYQLYLYARALSARTKIALSRFGLAYFDDRDYFEVKIGPNTPSLSRAA